MDYKEITVTTTHECADIVSLILIEEGSEGVSVKDIHDIAELYNSEIIWDYIDNNILLDNDKNVYVKGFFHNDKDLSNETLLMVALFKKGITGDVGAISKIIEMMEKLDMMEETGKMLQNNVVINLIPSGQTYEPNEEDEKEIWEAENDEWMDEEEDDEWGNEVYTP